MNDKLFPARAVESHVCKPSGFVEYDELSGYVTRQYVSEWQDKDGTRWRKIVTFINLGKPDRGIVRDPDAMIGRGEKLFGLDGSEPHWQKAVKAASEARVVREAQLVSALQQAFATHGPMSVSQVCAHVDAAKERILRALRGNRDAFRFFGDTNSIWGLHGQTYTHVKKVVRTKLAYMIRECLVQHGAQTAAEIAKRTGKHQQNVAHSLQMMIEWFEVAGQRPGQGHVPPARIWTLTEAGRRAR